MEKNEYLEVGKIVKAIDVTFTKSQLQDGLKIKKGKKHFHKAILL